MNNVQITSFDAENAGIFGDVLTKRPPVEKPQVGLLALGYFEYWRMSPVLREMVESDLNAAAERLKKARGYDDEKIASRGRYE